jgi:oxygen-independent coproporphyrinogen-3 oxidase
LIDAASPAQGAATRSVKLEQPPVGLYVHLPWCVKKCPYCDFNSHELRGALPEADYRRALIEDLTREYSGAPFTEVRSVFFGGGTPSLFPAATIEACLKWLDDRGLLASGAEVTLEANPGTLEKGSFAAFAAAGINRVSLGVQSFSDRSLQRLGRIHDAGEAWRAIDDINGAGIGRFNLDLMYGLPDQTPDEAFGDLAAALSAEPSHISHYQLTIEPNTLFHARPPPLPGDDSIWEAHLRCSALLAERGYRRYEVSAYALPGFECIHNLNYWRFGDYIGVGAGAHGKRTFPTQDRVVRTVRTRHPSAYMGGLPVVQESREIPAADRVFEFMLNATRLTGGFDERLFESTTGQPIGSVAPRLREAVNLGLLERMGPRGWRPTDRGQRFLNDLQVLFLPDDA